ncbi:hypothetical protein BGX33_009975 [Mortierella sp. NVP41]|nr:hypothetical protein BGX33_009975 [Mortierella sp. NVP41]
MVSPTSNRIYHRFNTIVLASIPSLESDGGLDYFLRHRNNNKHRSKNKHRNKNKHPQPSFNPNSTSHQRAEKICESCFGVCLVPESFGVLPVAVTRTSDTVMIQMCRACRLTLYFEHPEPLPAHLALSCQGAYQVGRRVDKTTIEYIYGKIHDDLSRLLPYEIEVRRNGRTRRPLHTYMEQDVLKLARREHGGDIGIIANRAHHQLERHRVYDKHGECRRALLRSVLYDKGLFPDEQAAIWKVYVETGVGDPVEIVNETDTYRWLFQSLIRHPPSPNTDKARLSQILTSEGEPISVKDPRAAAKAAGVKVLTPEEEMRADDERMAALGGWLEDDPENRI